MDMGHHVMRQCAARMQQHASTDSGDSGDTAPHHNPIIILIIDMMIIRYYRLSLRAARPSWYTMRAAPRKRLYCLSRVHASRLYMPPPPAPRAAPAAVVHMAGHMRQGGTWNLPRSSSCFFLALQVSGQGGHVAMGRRRLPDPDRLLLPPER
jgi:hypothetical protein